MTYWMLEDTLRSTNIHELDDGSKADLISHYSERMRQVNGLEE